MPAEHGERRALSRPYWEPARPATPRTLPPEAEVVVVGAGITGAATARWLQLRGMRPVVLEREGVAAGASGRNAGFLLSGIASNYRDAIDRYGRPLTREVWQFTRDSRRLFLDLVGGWPCDLLQRGAATLGSGAEETARLREAHELMRQDALPVAWRDQGGQGAVIDPEAAEVDPVRAVGALFVGHEEVLHPGVNVTAIQASSDGVRLDTSAGEIRAGAVVLATNAWGSELAPVAVRPVRAQMLAIPAPGVVVRQPTYSHHGYRYWRSLENGTLLVGGQRDRDLDGEVGYDLGPTEVIQHHLDLHARELGATAPATHRWAGTMGFSPDELPMAGEVPGLPGVHFCGGYSGHGFGFAVHCARILVARLAGGPVPPAWMDPSRGSANRQAESEPAPA
ncbi:MAG: NAD(P)/FAD-dependent oxidoreductase [Candidatus Dormibacteria bacterium]